MRPSTTFITAGAILFSNVGADELYPKSSPVLQVNSRTYESLVLKSNHTSIVEFYAPWCGHCQALKPAYEKAAKKLQGLAKVAAVNCDLESNKPFCEMMGVQGFPTLKIVKPTKKKGKPIVEDYQGQRTTKAIVEAVVDKIPNHIKRANDQTFKEWLKADNDTAKAILFTEKGSTSALLRALAIDYLGSINFGQIRKTEKDSVELFGITSFPTFVLLPGGDKDSIVYDGELKKDDMSKFLKQVATPNPDPAPEEPKPKKEKVKPKSAGADEGKEKKKPIPQAETPIAEPAQITDIGDEVLLQERCLSPKSRICILALLPEIAAGETESPKHVQEARRNLAQIHQKHSRRQSLFPFYAVPSTNPLAVVIRRGLGLKSEADLEIIAVNSKRLWWRRYPAADYKLDSIESWVDTIRMNEGKKEKLPEELVASSKEEDSQEKPQEQPAEEKPKEEVRDEL